MAILASCGALRSAGTEVDLGNKMPNNLKLNTLYKFTSDYMSPYHPSQTDEGELWFFGERPHLKRASDLAAFQGRRDGKSIRFKTGDQKGRLAITIAFYWDERLSEHKTWTTHVGD
jgi:hypothetical protein